MEAVGICWERPRARIGAPKPFLSRQRLVASPTMPSWERPARSDISGRFSSHPRIWMRAEAVPCVLRGELPLQVAGGLTQS